MPEFGSSNVLATPSLRMMVPLSVSRRVNAAASMNTVPEPSPGRKVIEAPAALPDPSATANAAVTAPVRPDRSAVNRPCPSSVTATGSPPSKLTVMVSMSPSSPVTAKSTAAASVPSTTARARSPPASAVVSPTSPPGAGSSRMMLLVPVLRSSVRT